MAETKIEWADRSWNPVRGCSRVSDGCVHCYAERFAMRMSGPGQAYEGLVEQGPYGPRWTGTIKLVPAKLTEPLHWRKPARIFVNSMSDLYHDDVPYSFIDKIKAVEAMCPQHIFIELTKRPGRLQQYAEITEPESIWETADKMACDLNLSQNHTNKAYLRAGRAEAPWPLPNVWNLISAESQATLDRRVPVLLDSVATVRGMSYEPGLGAVDFDRGGFSFLQTHVSPAGRQWEKLDWIIVGGESGPGARDFDIKWARKVVDQCRAAGVACYVKQLGSACVTGGNPAEGTMTTGYPLRHPKGGDPAEWPADLRVRQFPGDA